MSYEGYVQCLCINGHRCDQPEPYGQGFKQCDICNGSVAWTNPVDTTNCDSWGIILEDVFRSQLLMCPARTEVCNLGHSHVVAHAVYRVPVVFEMDKYRKYLDESGNYRTIPAYGTDE